jgi:NAD(P)-dependent dehydrogenase (short-subunit alcohol dehydrogenase family)
MTLNGRVAVVSGASGSLGNAISRELAERGANLALLDRDADKLADITSKLQISDDRIITLPVDLLDASGVRLAAKAVAGKFGRIDILLHLVGGWTGGKTILESTADELTFMLNKHIWTSFHVIQAFVPHLVRNSWGRVVMVTSPYGKHAGAKVGPFSIGKSGQNALMLALAQEIQGSAVTANLLQVRTIDARGEKAVAPSVENSSWTSLDDLVGAILYLLSDEAKAVNGAILPLHGAFY